MLSDPLLPLFVRGPKQYRAWPKASRPAAITYASLGELLTTQHDGDAHLAAYSVPSVLHRLGTDPPAYARVPGGVPMCVFLIDIDCAQAHRATGGTGGAVADDAWWRDLHRRIRILFAVHPGGVAYRTRGGARIIYRLPVPHVVSDAASEIAWKRRYLGVLAYLARRFEILGDPSISDWPRLIRLPLVMRDGKATTTEWVGDPRAVGALEYSPDEASTRADIETVRGLAVHVKPWSPALRILAGNVIPVARTSRPPRLVPARSLDAGTWEQLAGDLGRALRSHSGRHGVHLALAAACYERGVPLADGPTLARAICAHSGESDDRPQVWETTAQRVAGGQVVTGFGWLLRHAPDLAAAIDAALPRDGGARAARDELDARGVPTEVSAADAAPAIRAALVAPPPGLSVVRSTEGSGKTRATAGVLREAAEAGAGYERVPSAAKVLYAAPSHAVAAEVAGQLRGTRAVYRRGVLAVLQPDGSRACTYHAALSSLTASGHAAATWCDGRGMGRAGTDAPCPHREGCAAYAGQTVALGPGDATPVVEVTVHALLGEGLGWVGEHGRVIIDEDPAGVEAVTLTRAELEAAGAGVDGFSLSEQWRGPVLRALAAGLERGLLPVGEALAEVWRRGCAALAEDEGWRTELQEAFGADTVEQALSAAAIRAAWVRVLDSETSVWSWRRRGSWAPRPHPRERDRVFRGQASAAFAAVSRTHALVARVLAGVLRSTPVGCTPHGERAVTAAEVAELDPTRRVLRAVMASAPVSAAMRRYGPTVLLDATADLQVLGALAGGAPPVTEVRVADGARVTRELLHWSGTKRQVLPEGDLVRWDTGLSRYAREALNRCLGRGAKAIGLITWRVLAARLRAALEGDTSDPVASALVGQLRAAGATLRVGYYGNVRGRNDWLDCDALVSLGDPKPNLGATRAIAAVLGLSADHSAVYRRATAAESSQVAGRLRAPWRESPALHVHVGTIPPASWDARAGVLELPKGPESMLATGALVEAVGVYGQRVTAGVSGTGERTIRRATNSPALSTSHTTGQVTLSKTVIGVLGRSCDTSESQENRPKPLTFRSPVVFGGSQVDLIAAAGGAAAVALLVGVSRPTAYHWASGKRPMPQDLQRVVRETIAQGLRAPSGGGQASDEDERRATRARAFQGVPVRGAGERN